MGKNDLLVLLLVSGCAACGVATDTSSAITEGCEPLSLVVLGKRDIPQAGAPVVTHSADGTVVETATTAGNGRAALGVPAGGAVTVATRSGDQLLLTTVFGVEPGDDLTVQDAEGEPLRGVSLGEARIRLPAPFPGASSVEVGTPCGRASVAPLTAMVSRPLFLACAGGDTLQAIASARGEQNLAFASASAPAGEEGADLTLSPWVPAADLDVTLVGAPSGTSVEETELVAGHAAVGLGCQTVSGTVLRCPVPSTPLAGAVLRVRIVVPGPLGARELVTDLPSPSGAPQIDVGALPPALSAPAVDLVAPGRPRVRWSADGPLGELDVAFVLLGWTDHGGVEHTWLMVMPPGLSVTAPELPPQLAAWAPDVAASDLEVERIWIGRTRDRTPYARIRARWPELARTLTRSTSID